MKYKKLTKEQIIISLDRLTRFKFTKDRYLRVFSDIILSNLIEPKLKKADIEKMDYADITSIVEEIFNESVCGKADSNQFNINIYIKEHENSIYINDFETEKLLDNNINYINAINYIETDCPINLKWLKTVAENNGCTRELREKYALKYPLEEIILVEGITEEILLPAFSEFLGHNFDKKGIQIIAAGGKNQVVKMYYKLIEEVKLPIFILLDKDAEENISQIKPRLRKQDRIHLVSCGEFEDLLPHSLILKTINNHFENFVKIDEETLSTGEPMAKILTEFFRTKGLHEFKKAEFAKLVKENINNSDDISEEINNIIKEIFN